MKTEEELQQENDSFKAQIDRQLKEIEELRRKLDVVPDPRPIPIIDDPRMKELERLLKE